MPARYADQFGGRIAPEPKRKAARFADQFTEKHAQHDQQDHGNRDGGWGSWDAPNGKGRKHDHPNGSDAGAWNLADHFARDHGAPHAWREQRGRKVPRFTDKEFYEFHAGHHGMERSVDRPKIRAALKRKGFSFSERRSTRVKGYGHSTRGLALDESGEHITIGFTPGSWGQESERGWDFARKELERASAALSESGIPNRIEGGPGTAPVIKVPAWTRRPAKQLP